MANVGTAAAGKTLIGAGNGVSPTFASIGTNSGLTNNTFLLAQGNNPFVSSGALTNGQLFIGSTGAAPIAATLTASTGIVIVNGPGSISIGLAGGGAAVEHLTGDTGGILNPTANNFNLLGRSGSKTSGSVSTLTIKSPPYADQGGSTTVTLNSGSFATAAITLTLPASIGLADGDLFEFVCTTAGALIIQAVGAQKIRAGTLLSSAAGTFTSTNVGDAITLRFRATDGFFYATSIIGTWLVA